ncbi:hypothetical protein IWX49DRAFT_301679 [Phyllosticta citricarpa]|uniref:Secreted protein n=1 Tax=Phyllosticta paracitricarpa TaxID=2016321 RepID=A0ABR1NDE0_9PEZI
MHPSSTTALPYALCFALLWDSTQIVPQSPCSSHLISHHANTKQIHTVVVAVAERCAQWPCVALCDLCPFLQRATRIAQHKTDGWAAWQAGGKISALRLEQLTKNTNKTDPLPNFRRAVWLALQNNGRHPMTLALPFLLNIYNRARSVAWYVCMCVLILDATAVPDGRTGLKELKLKRTRAVGCFTQSINPSIHPSIHPSILSP